MMLRVATSVAIALVLFQIFAATESASTGLKQNEENDFQLDSLSKNEVSLDTTRRIIEGKTYEDMKGADSKKPWLITRVYRRVKDAILSPFKWGWGKIKKVYNRKF